MPYTIFGYPAGLAQLAGCGPAGYDVSFILFIINYYYFNYWDTIELLLAYIYIMLFIILFSTVNI